MIAKYDSPLNQCLICGSRSIGLLFTDCRGNDIARCECGFQFMNPQYTDDYLKEYYSQYGDFTDDGLNKWAEPLLYGHDFYFQLIEKFIQPPGRMLDIGSGTGFLLQAAQKRNWSTEGYDVDPQLTERVSQKLGIKIFSGDFFKAGIPDSSYDLITMHQVLEHVKQPVDYLKKIKQLLKPQGYFFIAVPNIASSSNRWKFFLESLGLRKKRRGVYYDSNHHLSYFNPKVLRSALESHGFEVLFTRNCHTVRPGQSQWSRWVARNITEYIFSKSAFLMIARKK